MLLGGHVDPPLLFSMQLVNTFAMKWMKIYKESEGEGETKSIPVEVSTREVKLIQNYLNKGKSLNDPSNKECQEVVLRILNDIVDNSQIENLDTFVSNFFFDKFGIEVEIDPYGENSAIELAENGMIRLSDCEWEELSDEGAYKNIVQGGFWDDFTGKLEEGFVSVDDMNMLLSEIGVGNGIKAIHLKKEGDVAKLLLDFN